MGLLDAGSSSGGSVNSASSQNMSTAQSVSESFSKTFGSEATAKSYAEAIRADERQRRLMQETQAYNSLEAAIQRGWQEKMANSVYTRSVKNMIEAGINPVLAASAGLSAANVGSGAAANISVPSTFMGQTFPDQISRSYSISNSNSIGSSQEKGSSWQQSQYGVAEALDQIAGMITNWLDTKNSGNFVNNITENMSTMGNEFNKWAVNNLPSEVVNALGLSYSPEKEGHYGSSVQRDTTITGKAKVQGREKEKNHSGGGTQF